MITWIQLILQKHHKYVFSVLLVVIIIAFVFTIGSSIPFFGDRNAIQQADRQDFYGWDLQDQNVVQKLYMGTYYDMLLSGEQVQNQEQIQGAILSRAILLSMAKQMNVPTVSEAEYAAYIHNSQAFLNSDGTFSQGKLDLFISQHSAMGNALLNSLLLENALVNKMRALIAGVGYVQDCQIDKSYSMLNSKYTFSLASLDLANFNPEIAIDEAKLVAFYETNKVRFEVAPEISLQVAFFPVSEFANAQVAVSDEQLQYFYNNNKALFMVEKDGKQELESFEVAKAKVETEFKKAQILRMAMQKAQDFSDAVYDANTTFNSEAFKGIVADSKVSLKQVPAYSSKATEAQLPKDYPVDVLRAGLELDATNWLYNEIISSEEGAYVVFLDSIKPAYVPELTDIRIQIERDYKASETYALFAAKASALETSLKTAVAEKKSFDEVAKAEGALVENFADFSFVKPETAQVQALSKVASLMEELTFMKADEMSRMSMLDGKAYVFFLSKVETPVVDKESAEYKTLATSIATMSAAQSAWALISEKERAFEMQQAK